MLSPQIDDLAAGWPLRLLTLRKRLHLDQQEMGAMLGVEREWVSRLENGKGAFSDAIKDAIQAAEGEAENHKRVLVAETSPQWAQPPSAPSTRTDVERYFRLYCDAAAGTGDADVFPAIMRQLKKHFPLDEFEQP